MTNLKIKSKIENNKDIKQIFKLRVANLPNVEYVSVDDVPQDVVDKEKLIEMGRDDLANKPKD